MSAYHRHYRSVQEAHAAGEGHWKDEGHGQSTRFVECDDCDGLWAVSVNEQGNAWTGWPECPVQSKREEDRVCRGC